MKIFKDAEECIFYSKCAINHYPSLSEVIKASDFDLWKRKLNNCSDLTGFLLSETSKLNILNLSVAIGLSMTKSLDDLLFAHYKRLFKKVDLYLATFPELKTDKKFKAKLKNLEGLNFLSTLSELSLAHKLKEYGLIIKFETKFKQLNTGKNRDVDISVFDGKNNVLHLEVYMPNKQLDISGFFDITQDNDHFNSKIENKLIDKFGKDGISGLSGMILLAVNKAFFDMLHMITVLSFVNNDYKELAKLIPKDVDGILIYEDGFESDNSFRFEKIILKKESIK